MVEGLREKKWQMQKTAYRVKDTWVWAHIRENVIFSCTRFFWAFLIMLRCAHVPTRLLCECSPRQLTAGKLKPLKGSRDESEWPGHYSATTNNSPQDKGSFVTRAALTNSMQCGIKLANTPLPLCDTARVESPLGKTVGESPLSDKHYHGHGQKGPSIMREMQM